MDPQTLDAELRQRAHRLLEHHLSGDAAAATEDYLVVLDHFARVQYQQIAPNVLTGLALFLKNLFAVVCEPSYTVPDRYIARVVQLSPILGTLTAMSPFGTTDAFLDIVREQPRNFVKLLLLANARCRTQLDIQRLFDANATVASIWYSTYVFSTYSRTSSLVDANARAYVQNVPEQLEYIVGLSLEPMFASSYIDEIHDRGLKERFNQSIQRKLSGVRIKNRPDPRKIAILSQRWVPTSSVYKILRHFIAALKPSYHLTFVQLGGESAHQSDLALFDEVRRVGMTPEGRLNIKEVEDNDFQVALYPDVGMSEESLLLSNLRLCPIQCASYGHSVSTWGSLIDFWIGGRDAEPEENPQDNYSERLVLIPGSGGPPVIPDYTPVHPDRPADRIIANCPWGAYKLNASLIEDLKVIRDEVKSRGRRVLFRFFPGAGGIRNNNFLLLRRDLAEAFGNVEDFELVPDLQYRPYMEAMEQGHLMLDSYPFGGCNSVMDALWLGQPLVTRYGREWNNRYGLALLRRFGLEEMAVSEREDYRRLAVRMIVDDGFRGGLAGKIAGQDLIAGSWDRSEADAFRQAIDFLIANQDALRADSSRAPIRIEA